MLHTDAHSNCIENKMTVKEFINNNKGVNGGGDFPDQFLESLFERVTQDEIKIEGGSAFSTAIKKGFVWTKAVTSARSPNRRTVSSPPRRSTKTSARSRPSPTKSKWRRMWCILAYDTKAPDGSKFSLELFKSPTVRHSLLLLLLVLFLFLFLFLFLPLPFPFSFLLSPFTFSNSSFFPPFFSLGPFNVFPASLFGCNHYSGPM